MTFPVVFISFDEPNAEQNWLHLKSVVPSALRVHGVSGFDAAHKFAAKHALSVYPDARRFFTVDGDSQLAPQAWAKLIADDQLSSFFREHVLSWNAFNVVNNLVYGNGGLKLWPIPWVLSMRTHEASTSKVKTDFCWEANYLQLTSVLTTTHINGSGYQAWRSGYREAVKLQTPGQPFTTVGPRAVNFKRLIRWMTLGRDVPNGALAILGALQGYVDSRAANSDAIIDYHSFFPILWSDTFGLDVLSQPSPKDVEDKIGSLRPIAQELLGLPLPTFGPISSETCKLFLPEPLNNNLLELEPWSTTNLQNC